MTDYAWTPQKGTQLKAITATWCEELFFGGSRGSGKSDFLLGDFAQDVNVYKEHWHGVIFRKTYPELDQLIQRSKEIYPEMGAVWQVQSKTWKFPSGASLKMRSMEREDDADKYQGHEYSYVAFDELTNWPTDVPYSKLKACLRSSVDIEHKRIRSSGNPGGPGHAWVKDRFIDPQPNGMVPIVDIRYINARTGAVVDEADADDEVKNDPEFTRSESKRIFIPSNIMDNKILMKNDPLYIARLAQTGGKALVAAWISGDWNIIEGAYFDDWDQDKHVIAPFMIPDGWRKIRAFDWGYSAPFCVLWGAVSDGSLVNVNGVPTAFPKDSIIIYREYYGTTGKPNEGLKIHADEIARNIMKFQEFETVHDYVADPAIYDVSVGESIAEQMFKLGCHWRPADNKRIPGWQQIRYRMRGIDGRPLLYFFDTCHNCIRTIPIMQYDKTRPEDLDTKLEDHSEDTLRYLCMSRPLTVELPKDLGTLAEEERLAFNPKEVLAGLERKRKEESGFL